jgi:hypothetical protein
MVLVITESSSYPVRLGAGAMRLPSGAEVKVIDDWLELRVERSGATVNDVEVHGTTALHAGDVLAEAGLQYLVLPCPSAGEPRPAGLLEHWTWLRRLEEEVEAGTSSFVVLVGRSGAFDPGFVTAALTAFSPADGVRYVVGSLGRNALEVLILGDPAGADAFRQFLSDRAAARDETVRWGTASFPRHGATAEELWAAAVDRLLGLEPPGPTELVWSDPCMNRLRGFAERWSRRSGLALIGPEGVGRESLVRLIRAVGSPGAPFVVHAGARFDPSRWAEDVARAAGGGLHVRRPEMLPEVERRAFWAARGFRPSAGVAVDSTLLPEDRVVVPELTSRTPDVGPIAEMILHSVDAQLGRRRSSLRAETRVQLQALPTPENVRTLRNVVIRGALNATGGEVRPEHLDLLSAMPALTGVRAKIREAERREIESALQGSGWNVTEAARRMELPRRTLVYRMARLGVRRPA